nr:hypothetical protein [Tanacetum cinerariifolium]
KENTSKQERIDKMDADEGIALVSTHDDVVQDESIEDVGEEDVVEKISISHVIILSNSEDEFENSSSTISIHTSPTYTRMFDTKTAPFKDEPMDAEPYASEPDPEEDSSKEDPLEDEEEEPLTARVTPTQPTQPIQTSSYRPYYK